MAHKIVIIGVGAIADILGDAIAELPNATLIGGSCRTKSKGEEFARKYNCAWFDNYERMLDELRPDVAIVCTPSGAHLEPVAACARRKIHVICEKPLEISLDRIHRMIDAAEHSQIVLGAMFPQRFTGASMALHEAARLGRFGNLAGLQIAVPWWRDDDYYGGGRWQGTAALDGGGAFMNQSIHTIDLMQWFAGATMDNLPPDANPVEEVFAYTAQRGHDPSTIEVEDMAVAAVRFRNGALGSILGTTSFYPGSRKQLRIGGRDGSAELIDEQLVQYDFRNALPEDEAIRNEFKTQASHGGGAGNPMAITHEHHRRNIADFLEALEQNRPPFLSAIEAAKSVEIIVACYRSAATGQPVTISPRR
jgi:predicted dehydrogenase